MKQATKNTTPGTRVAMAGKAWSPNHRGNLVDVDRKGFATVRRDNGSEFFCAVGVLVVQDREATR